MADIAARTLRNRWRSVLRRVEDGEEVTITVDGRRVAVLQPLHARRRWMARSEFIAEVLSRQADPDLTQDLARLATDTLPA